MTFSANWKNKQWFRIIRMMILCAPMKFANYTPLPTRFVKFAFSDSITNTSICFYLFLISVIEFVVFSMCCLFSLFGSIISFIAYVVSIFTFLCLSIFLLGSCFTRFALVEKSVLSCMAFRKFRSGLELFASTTSFCYDWLKHGFFLCKKLCLEPFRPNICSAHCILLYTERRVK